MLTDRQRDVINTIYEAIRARRCGYICGRTEITVGEGILYCSFGVKDDYDLSQLGNEFVTPCMLALEQGVAQDREDRKYYKYYLAVVYLEQYNAYSVSLVPSPAVCEAMNAV